MKSAHPALRWLLARASRYTRTVSWRHRISLVLLIVLTALPVSGTVCAMLCDSAAATRAAAHHGSGNPATTSRRLLLRRVRRCGAQPATTAAIMTLPSRSRDDDGDPRR